MTATQAEKAKYVLDKKGKLQKIAYSEWSEQFPEPIKNRLFVYGIFLGADMRSSYGMTNPAYATVPGYITVGNHIVQALKVDDAPGIALTGLVVDIDPECWHRTDALEGAYDRRLVKTSSNEDVYMYVQRERRYK